MEELFFCVSRKSCEEQKQKKMPPDEKQRQYFLMARSCVCDQASFCVRAERSDFMSRR